MGRAKHTRSLREAEAARLAPLWAHFAPRSAAATLLFSDNENEDGNDHCSVMNCTRCKCLVRRAFRRAPAHSAKHRIHWRIKRSRGVATPEWSCTQPGIRTRNTIRGMSNQRSFARKDASSPTFDLSFGESTAEGPINKLNVPVLRSAFDSDGSARCRVPTNNRIG